MHTIYADKLFKNKDILSSINLDTERPLTIDFKNVSEFLDDLKIIFFINSLFLDWILIFTKSYLTEK